MSADQGVPPVGQPPDDANASRPNALPPWLRDEDETERPAPSPSPIRPITPPPPPPEPALPPWLQDDEPEAAPGVFSVPIPGDWLSAGDALPESADSELTFDEWAAQQQELARPRDLEEEVPDLSDELNEPAPGTGPLNETGTLPDWYLGMDEIAPDDLPDWFDEPEVTGPGAQPLESWSAAGSPPESDDELPGPELWADFPADEDNGALPGEAADDPWLAFNALHGAEIIDQPAAETDEPDEDGFDEPTFDWLSSTTVTPEAEAVAEEPADAIDEPELDGFFTPPAPPAPPPETPAVPVMDEVTAHLWLAELEGMVAEVAPPADEPEQAASAGTPAEAAMSGDEAWEAAFGSAPQGMPLASEDWAQPAADDEAADEPELGEDEAWLAAFGGESAGGPAPDSWQTSFTEDGSSELDPGGADDQAARADVGWLMDMQGSGELSVTEPATPQPVSSEAELAAFAALFNDDAAPLSGPAGDAESGLDSFAEPDFMGELAEPDIFAAPALPDSALAAGTDFFAEPDFMGELAEPDISAAPAAGTELAADDGGEDIFAAAAHDPWWSSAQASDEAGFELPAEDMPVPEAAPEGGAETEFDTGWLTDDIFGEAAADDEFAALAAGEPLPGDDELTELGDVPEFDALIAAPLEAGASGSLDLFGGDEPPALDALDLFGEADAQAEAPEADADELPDWMLADALSTAADDRAAPPAAEGDQDWLIGLGLAAGRAAFNAQELNAAGQDLNAEFMAPAEDEWMRKLQTGRLGEDEPAADEQPAYSRAGLSADEMSQVSDVEDYLSLLMAPKVGTGDDAITPVASAYDLDVLLNQNLGTGELSSEFDWYDAPPSEPEAGAASGAYDPYRGTQPFLKGDEPELDAAPETPDWLSDVTVTTVSAGAMVRQQKDRPEGELDERLQKLRRRGPAEPSAEAIDLTAAAPGFGPEVSAPRGDPGTLTLTPEQDRQAALLMELVGATTGARAGTAEVAASGRARGWRAWGGRAERWVIFALLAALMLLPFFVSDLRVGNLPPPAFPEGSASAAAFDAIEALPPGALALVGVDYSLGASAELDVMTDALLRHLLLRNVYPVLISGNAATLARMQALVNTMSADPAFMGRLNLDGPLVDGRDYFTANFLPGGALGLRAFSENTATLLLPALRAALPGIFVSDLGDFKLIAVLSDRAEDMRAYLEQIAPLANAPVVAGVSYGAAPLAEPYYAAGALDGLWVGYQDGLTYSLLTGGVLSAGAAGTALDAAPRDSGPAAPLTQFTATFTPSPTFTPTQTPSPTQTPTPSPTPAPVQAVIPGTQAINLRAGPATTEAILQVLQPGTTLTVVGFNDERTWAQVELASGVTGWVAADLIRIQQGGASGPAAWGYGKRPAPRNQELTPVPPNTRRPTLTREATATPTENVTATPPATRTPLPSATNTATASHTPTVTPSPTTTPSPTATLTPSATPTPTPVLVAGGGALNLPAHTPGYRDERWYAMTLGIIGSAAIIGAGALFNLIRSLRRRR